MIAIASWDLFWYAGRHAHTTYDLEKVASSEELVINDVSHDKTTEESYWKQTLQILSDRNFLAFVIANFCHEIHRTFLNNFMAIICDQLISSQDIPSNIRKLFYGGITILPQVRSILKVGKLSICPFKERQFVKLGGKDFVKNRFPDN